MRYMVKVVQSFGAFVVVEAADEAEAEDAVSELVDDGTIDVVGLKGTLPEGDGGLTVECMGPTDLGSTVPGKESNGTVAT